MTLGRFQPCGGQTCCGKYCCLYYCMGFNANFYYAINFYPAPMDVQFSQWELVSGTKSDYMVSGSYWGGFNLSGKIKWNQEIPDDTDAWQVAVTVSPLGHAGAKIRIGIGGKTVEFVVGSTNPSVGDATVSVVDTSTDKRVVKYPYQFSQYGDIGLYGSNTVDATLAVNLNSCEGGSFLLRAGNNCGRSLEPAPWGGGAYWNVSYPLVLAKVNGTPSREITVEVIDGPVPITGIAIVRMADYDAATDSFEATNCKKDFCSPCSYDPQDWNANGSPCCLGSWIAWIRPGDYSARTYYCRWAHIGPGKWSTQILSKDPTDTSTSSWSNKRMILYYPTLEITGATWKLTVKHPVTGTLIYEETRNPPWPHPWLDARDSQSFGGNTTETAPASYYATPAILVNFNQLPDSYYYINSQNSYDPGCTATRYTCSGCQSNQFPNSATVTVNGSVASGTYVVPITDCKGTRCFYNAFTKDGRKGVLGITVELGARPSVVLNVGWAAYEDTICGVSSSSSQEGIQMIPATYRLSGPFDCTTTATLPYDEGAWIFVLTPPPNSQWQWIHNPAEGLPSSVTMTLNLAPQW